MSIKVRPNCEVLTPNQKLPNSALFQSKIPNFISLRLYSIIPSYVPMSYTHPIWDFNTYTYGYIRPRLVDNLSVASDNTPQYSGPNCWSPFGENRSVKRFHIPSNMPFPIFMFSTSSRTFNFDLSGGTLESNKQRQGDDGEEMSEGIRALVTCLIRAVGLTNLHHFQLEITRNYKNQSKFEDVSYTRLATFIEVLCS